MSQIWDIYCKHCLWSIFGPCLCTKSCKTTFYAHLSQIWKLTGFTCFIRKVFATKILPSGKFSLFVTLSIFNVRSDCVMWKKLSVSKRGCVIFLFVDLINAVKAWVCYAFGNVVYMSNGSNNIWFPKITLCQSAFLGTALLQNFGIHCFFDSSFLPYH